MIETRRLKNVILLQIIDMTNLMIYQMLLHYCATYLFKVKNGITRTWCDVVLVFLLLTLNIFDTML